ncbi:ROK family protein, partial [bacterium]|nr:ROK family protein [bacterium]
MIETSTKNLSRLAAPAVLPPLDDSFRPLALANREFRRQVEQSGGGVPLVIGLERADGTRSRYETKVFAENNPSADLNLPYIERIVKMLLWQKGGYKLIIGGPAQLGEQIAAIYSKSGARAFDWEFMGNTVYEKPFEVVVTGA